AARHRGGPLARRARAGWAGGALFGRPLADHRPGTGAGGARRRGVGGRMTSAQLDIQLIAVVVAVTCALVGAFLLLRRMALMSDAISHSILLGIVGGFFLAGDVSSPLPVAGAALTGLATVWLVELIRGTALVREDAAIGLVFPALFSV